MRLAAAFATSPVAGLRLLACEAGFALAVRLIVAPAVSVFLWMLSLSLENELDNTS